jgi:hypothetical protein
MGKVRTFWRNYAVEWDSRVTKYRVTLGHDLIGYRETQEGARLLASAHAKRTALFREISFTVAVQSRPNDSVDEEH